jgi:hypothetical protein
MTNLDRNQEAEKANEVTRGNYRPHKLKSTKSGFISASNMFENALLLCPYKHDSERSSVISFDLRIIWKKNPQI